MFLWKRRPRPKYGVADILLRLNGTDPHRFMVVRRVRWVRPNGETARRWVYDGPVIEAVGKEIVVATYISCVSEQDVCRVTWHEHNRHLLDPRLQMPEAA